MIEDAEDFSFEADTHEYRNSSGITCPSVTQILKTAGVFDYSTVRPDVLEIARRRGTNVHRLTEEFDRYGDIDETWIGEEESSYFEAWRRFRRESGFHISDIEKPMLREIAGVEVGGTPDRIGFLGSQRFVLDIKTCSTPHPGWGLQLGLYEFLITRCDRVGHLGRIVVMLRRNGTYRTIIHDDHSDGACALHIVHKIAAERAIKNWKINHGISIAD